MHLTLLPQWLCHHGHIRSKTVILLFLVVFMLIAYSMGLRSFVLESGTFICMCSVGRVWYFFSSALFYSSAVICNFGKYAGHIQRFNHDQLDQSLSFLHTG